MHNRLSDPVKETSICALNKTTCINSKDFAKIILKDRNGKNEEDNNEESVDIVEIKAKELNCSGDYNQKQLCIMEKLNKKKELIKYFKPITKSYSHSHWLNNTEIDTVQYQLMLNYKGYYYSNIHMIDFGMFNPRSKDIIEYDPLNIKNIDFIKELKGEGVLNENGKLKYYGVVINTDVSSGSGIHWFAIFMDFSKTPATIEYFNSSGYDIKNKDFKIYFIKLADTITLNAMPCKFIKVSDIQHQSSSTSNCGVYSLYYIWKRLGGESMEFFQKNKIDDNHIVLFRKYFFRQEA